MSQTKAQLIDPVDGSLVNADINASAAIAGTKISPNFGSQNILTTGNGGIGTASPATLLHLSRTSTTSYSTTNTTNDSTFLIVNAGAAGHSTMQLQCLSGGTANTGQATISAFAESNSSKNTTLSFGTRRNSDSAVVERMRIDSSGKVHIGLTNGAGQFCVKNQNDSATNALEVYNDNGVRVSGFSQSSAGDASMDLRTNAASQTVLLRANGISHLSGGNVGIGTTGPEGLLHIEASSSGSSYSADAADTLILERNGGCVIDFRTPAANDSGLLFSDGSRAVGTILYNHPDNSLRIGTSSSERMRIDSSGRILIGTSASLGVFGLAAQIQIAGSTAGSSSLALRRFGNSAQGAFITLSKSRNAADGNRTIVQDGDELGRVAFCADDGTDLVTGAAEIQANVDGTPGSNDMPGRLTFHTTPNDSATLSERMRIDKDGKVGINASSPASRLDVRDDSTSEGLRVVHTNGTAGIGIGYNTILATGSNTNNNLDISTKGTGSTLNCQIGTYNVFGAMADSRDFRIFKNANGWSTLTMDADGGITGPIRRHVRKMDNGQNFVATKNVFRLRRHNWGSGFFEVRMYATYYSGSYLRRFRIMGHGAGGNSYSVLTMDDDFTNGSGADWGVGCQIANASNSAPGDNSTYFCDVQVTIPNYWYGICELIMSSGYQTNNANAGTSMGSNSYTLWT